MDQYLFLLSMSGCRTMLMFADANSQTLCLYASYTYISYIYDISLFYNMGSALSLCMNIEYLCLLLISRCRTMPMFADATVSCNKSTRTMAAGPRGGGLPLGGGGPSPLGGRRGLPLCGGGALLNNFVQNQSIRVDLTSYCKL